MATKKIGSAGGGTRDYSTVQAWEDSLIAVLVAEEIGECYNDTEFAVAGTVVSFSGSTTALSTDIILRSASGQGFRAGVATNAPRYDTAKGVGLNCTSGYGPAMIIDEDYVTIQNIQITNTTTAGSGTLLDLANTYANTKIKDCLWELNNASGSSIFSRFRGGTASNCLLVMRVSTNGNGIQFDYSSSPVIINCTIVRPSDKTAGGIAIASPLGGGSATVKNCQMFGFTTINSVGLTYTTCQTDKATPPTGCTQVTYGNQFTTTTDVARDFRPKVGADSIDAGTVDTTNLPDADDIVGTARGATWDCGWMEFVAAGGGTADPTFSRNVRHR